jgi:serine/threonine protein kinase
MPDKKRNRKGLLEIIGKSVREVAGDTGVRRMAGEQQFEEPEGTVDSAMFRSEQAPKRPEEDRGKGPGFEGVKLEKWLLEEKLGQGGFAHVYRSGNVAIKFFDEIALRRMFTPEDAEDRIARFDREIDTLEDLENEANKLRERAEKLAAKGKSADMLEDGHKYVPRLIDSYKRYSLTDPETGETKTIRWFAMELLDEGELKVPETPEEEMTNEELMERIEGATKALKYAHEKLATIHRDVKPANMGRGKDGLPKLLDWGVARDTTAVTITGENTAVGTLLYMRPEAIGGKPPDPLDDLYSLGVTIYNIQTLGRLPFESNDAIQLIKMIADDVPKLPSELYKKVDKDWEAFAVRLMRGFYESAAEFLGDLKKKKAGEMTDARRGFWKVKLGHHYSRHRRLVKFSGSLVAVVAAATIAIPTALSFRADHRAYSDLEKRLGRMTKSVQAVEGKKENLFSLKDLDQRADEAQTKADSGFAIFGSEKFRGIRREIEHVDDQIELRIAKALKDKTKSLDQNERELNTVLSELGMNYEKSKEDMIAKRGVIEKGKFPNIDKDRDGIWELDAGGRWIVAYYPASLLRIFQLIPDSAHEARFRGSIAPFLVKDFFKEKYNMYDLMLEVFARGADVLKDATLERIALEYVTDMVDRFDGKHIQCSKKHPNVLESTICTSNELMFWGYGRSGHIAYYNAGIGLTYLVADKLVKDDASTLWKVIPSKDYAIFEDKFSRKGLTWSRGHMRILRSLNTGILATGDMYLIEKAEKVADYYIRHMQGNLARRYLEQGPIETYNSIVGALALLELSRIESHNALRNPERAGEMSARAERYWKTGRNILRHIVIDRLSLDVEYQPAIEGAPITNIGETYFLKRGFEYLAKKPLFPPRSELVRAGETATLAGFRERNTGILSPKPTVGEVSYDSKNLYVTVRAEKEGESRMKGKDKKVWEDSNSAAIVIKNENRPAFVFAASSAGATYDGMGDDSKANLLWKVNIEEDEGQVVYNFKISRRQKIGENNIEAIIDEERDIGFNIAATTGGKTSSWDFQEESVQDYRSAQQTQYSTRATIRFQRLPKGQAGSNDKK